MSEHDRARVRAKRKNPRARKLDAAIRQSGREQRAARPEQLDLGGRAIASTVDRDFDLIGRVATDRHREALEEWDEIERIEAAELAATGGRIVRAYGRWGQPARYEIPKRVDTDTDDEAFLEAEREQLGVDRRAGTLRRPDG